MTRKSASRRFDSAYAERKHAEAWAAQRGWKCDIAIIDGRNVYRFVVGYDVMAHGGSWAEAIAYADRRAT